MTTIRIGKKVGVFAENKDVARDIRIKEIVPAIEKNDHVILDFSGVNTATQSFIHALISELFRKYGNSVLERMSFRSCNITIQKIIEIVSDYMQQGFGVDPDQTDDKA